MEKAKYFAHIIIALIIYPFTRFKFRNRKIWLIGGNAGELYVDNSRAMYEYLRVKKEIEVYWVVNGKSKVKDKIPGKKLKKGSIITYLYFMNAEAVLFSHSISADIVPYLYVVPIANIFHHKVLKVFLNHGTVGFKVRKALNEKTEKIAEKMVRTYDINICDSEYEKSIKENAWWNVSKETTYVTGYPRYDKLYDVEIEKKEIFFMPTWRNWLKDENTEIEKTSYFKNIIGFAKNEKLNEYLEKNGIILSIYIHQLMHKYLENFENITLGKNVELLPKEAEITKELMRSKILVTDYSSVAYDYYYLNKPIVFFQFDVEEYEEKVGSYIDLKEDIFGEVTHNIDECVDKIIEISDRNFEYDEKMLQKIEKLKDKFLKYHDKDNCKRVYKLILSKLGERNGRK